MPDVKRLSYIFPEPDLNIWAKPVDWVASGGTVEDWGRLRLMFNNEDVTFWRGVQTKVKSWVCNEPFSFATASVEFPQISPYEPLPPFLKNWSSVEIRLLRPNNTQKKLWIGMFADEEDNLTETGSGLTVQIIGSLYQADLYLMPPAITPKEDTDIGDIIRGVLDPANRPNLRTLPVIGTPFIGLRTRSGGSWDPLITGYIQGLLDQCTYLDVIGLRQWTLVMEDYRPVLRPKNLDTVSWTMRCGQPGITHSLTRDLSMMPTTIYGEGVNPDQCHWRNTKYPNLRTDDAPIFPGTILNPGHSGDGVAEYEQELYNNGYGVTVDDYYDPDEEVVIGQFQSDAGIQVDGVVGPQTWAAIFDTGSNGGDLTGAFFMPLYTDGRVQKWTYNASGGITGEQSVFDPEFVRVERHENMGNYITKDEGYVSAYHEARRDGGEELEAGYVGTFTLRLDPNEGSRFEIREGQNFLLQGHRGVDRLFHISQVDVDWEGQSVTLTVDTRARDQMTLAAILDRERENHDPARRKKMQYRNSKMIEDRRAQWDCENGSGLIPRHGTYAGLWNVLRIPAGELGTIVRTEFTVDEPAPFSVAVFDRPTTHSVLTSHGAPTDEGYWDSFPEDTGLIIAWGGSGQMAGYYPQQETSDDEAEPEPTGRMVDDSSWYYQTSFPPWLWVAIWVESPTVNYIQGQLTAGVND